MNAPLYFDHAATTPLAARVAEAMRPWLDALAGNASAAHPYGERARQAIEAARASVAALIGAEPREIVFTSGATEANNLAILGLARGRRAAAVAAAVSAGAAAARAANAAGHVVTTRIEHKAVLEPVRQLVREGFSVSWLDPDGEGRIAPQSVERALRADTLLVSVMHANNEIGVVQDIAAIGALCRAAGVPLHVDAAQSVGKLPLDLRRLPVDLLSLSAHKFNGPQGAGALYVRTPWRSAVQPLQFGGGQERGLRPGTAPVHQIVGLGAAAAIAAAEGAEDAARVLRLRERLQAGLASAGGVIVNGGGAERLPGVLNVSFAGVHGEALVASLPELALSTSAACNADSDETSYVLRAIGREPLLAQATLRFSLGCTSTQAEVDAAIAAVLRELPRLRALADLESLDIPGGPAAQGAAGGWGLGDAGARSTGAQVRWRVRIESGRVAEAGFRAFVPESVARVCATLAERLPGREAAALAHATASGGLGGPLDWQLEGRVPATQLGALLHVEDALRRAVQAAIRPAG